jgi:type VI secretion system protein ImpH
MIAMFYRAWAVNHAAVSFDRVAEDPETDRFGFYVASTIGLAEKTLRRRDGVPDIAKQHFAGRSSHQTKPPEGLAAILGDYFGMPCRIEEFVGQWIDIPESDRLRVGKDRAIGRLGESAVVGARTWDCTQKFRIVIGPLTLRAVLPPAPKRTLVRPPRRVGPQLRGTSSTGTRRSSSRKKRSPAPGSAATGVRPPSMLGWTTWMKTGPFERDADELVLRAPDEGELV